jgi:transposase-like protein
MAGKKGMQHYPRELKLEAMRMFFEDGKTRKEITAALGIRSSGRVKVWLQQYRAAGAAAFDKKKRGPGRPPKKEDTAAYIARLEMENELLKKYHTELRQGWLAPRNIGLSTDTGENTR